ncbi:MAG: beta-phosphoglucomutase family hydrolase [Phycisphaerales bacterium]|nr:beta-phosphoglucomutase family hydrolase [Phycisphaerales bacterium]
MAMHGLGGGLAGVLFDLDGVLVDTARFHFLAWKRLAEELGVGFNERINHGFRGVGRMVCLEMLLGEHERFFGIEEKRLLAERKNGYYLELVKELGPGDLAKGAKELAESLRACGVRLGLVSASCNARLVLRLLGIVSWFDAIVDGSECAGKREGFLRAARKMQVRAEHCVVIEDAEAGVTGARAAGMKCVGIGAGAVGADIRVMELEQVRMGMMEEMVGIRPASSSV